MLLLVLKSVFPISQWLPKMKPGAEYHATIRFVLMKDELWAPNGFEIASNQLKIEMIPNSTDQQNFTAPLTFKEDDTNDTIERERFCNNF